LLTEEPVSRPSGGDEPPTASQAIQKDRLLRQSSMLDAVADGILLVDETGTVVDMNPAAEDLFGATAIDLSQMAIEDLLPEVASLLPISALHEKSRQRGGIDATARRSDGTQSPVHVNVSVSREIRQRHYILVLRDFRQIVAAQRRNLETGRLLAIGETITALAHESRNALQRMQSCLSLIKLRVGSDVGEFIDDMQEAQDQLQQLYEEIRSFAAPMQLDLQPTDVRSLLKKTWRQLRVLSADRGVTWSLSGADDLDAVVHADSRRLGQVFRNILENAIEASPEGGRIAARLAESDEGGRRMLRIAIEDEGSGIAEDGAGKIFDLLFTTKPDGTGMGLAIAARIVREHDGTILVERSPELGGASLIVLLPREVWNRGIQGMSEK
jgi:PAS domain S-box-containing protein